MPVPGPIGGARRRGATFDITFCYGPRVAQRCGMYHHIKQLMYTVRIGTPDPQFGIMLLEQFGGANGELAAATQYSIQGLNCDDP